MNKITGWCRCGGPLWREDGCRLCWLDGQRTQVEIPPIGVDCAFIASQWLPPGQREVRPARSKTERACQFWLRAVQERDDQQEWRRMTPRAMNGDTFMDIIRRLTELAPWPVPDRSVAWSSPWDGISPEQRVQDAFQSRSRW